MINLLLGVVIGLIIGVILGGYVVFRFNVSDYTINGKYKLKDNAKFDLDNFISGKEKRKFKLFKRKRK